MKKLIAVLSILLPMTLLSGMFTAAAVLQNDPQSISCEKKQLTTYLYSMDDAVTTECLFYENLPSVAYINPVDYLSHIYKVDFSEKKNADGTYTIVKADDSTMTVNVETDTVYFDCYEHFAFNDVNFEGSSLENDFAEELPIEFMGTQKGVTLDLAKYDIDIVVYGGKVYFPLPTLSDIFIPTYHAAEYLDGTLYYVNTMDNPLCDGYFDKSSLYNTVQRDKTLIDYSYHELCFVMDYFYGLPEKAAISESIAEKGFDRTLEEYNDDTRTAKKLLNSENPIDLYAAFYYLNDYFQDGGHSVLIAEPAKETGAYPDTLMAGIMYEIVSERSATDSSRARIYDINEAFSADTLPRKYLPHSVRKVCYESYELVKEWDSGLFCLQSGKTFVFVFNSFDNDAVDAFKWSLDYAQENGISNFVLDISCNHGGDTNMLAYMAAIMMNKERHTNRFEFESLNTFTGNTIVSPVLLDLNSDGSIDEKDKEVVYDFNYALLTSSYSFSCGNLLSVIAKDNGIAILGQTSGGGECMISKYYLPESHYYLISGIDKSISESGRSVDRGAEPDYDLLSAVSDPETEVVYPDYTGFYDIDKLGQLVEEYYSDPQEYTIHFEADNGSGTMADVKVTERDKFTFPSCEFTAPKGMVFSYWTIGSDNNYYYPGNRIIVKDTFAVGDKITLSAHWEKAPEYTLRFSSGGGKGTMAAVSVTEGEGYRLPVCGFTAPEGEVFSHWTLSDDSGAYQEGDEVFLHPMENTELILTAHWKTTPAKSEAISMPETKMEVYHAGVILIEVGLAAVMLMMSAAAALMTKKR